MASRKPKFELWDALTIGAAKAMAETGENAAEAIYKKLEDRNIEPGGPYGMIAEDLPLYTKLMFETQARVGQPTPETLQYNELDQVA